MGVPSSQIDLQRTKKRSEEYAVPSETNYSHSSASTSAGVLVKADALYKGGYPRLRGSRITKHSMECPDKANQQTSRKDRHRGQELRTKALAAKMLSIRGLISPTQGSRKLYLRSQIHPAPGGLRRRKGKHESRSHLNVLDAALHDFGHFKRQFILRDCSTGVLVICGQDLVNVLV